MTSAPSRLSDRDIAVVDLVTRFRQASASQIRRFAFWDGSPASRGVRQRRTLARLVKWGALKRLPRPIGGGMAGSGEYIYLPPTSITRTPNPHTLDIVGLYIEMVEAHRRQDIELLAFDPEPYSHLSVGHIELKPDAFIDIRGPQGRFRYFLEMDLGSEWRPQLNAKMRRYNQAYKKWEEPTFPQVLFIVPDDQRKRMVESVVRRQEMPSHFQVTVFDEAVRTLTQSE